VSAAAGSLRPVADCAGRITASNLETINFEFQIASKSRMRVVANRNAARCISRDLPDWYALGTVLPVRPPASRAGIPA
jgi:hypothetical protein